MKIAMVCPFFLPVTGGMEKHVYNLSRELIALGNSVTVFTAAIDHEGKSIERKRQTIDGINVRRFSPLFRIGKFASFWPQVLPELRGFDIIHAHNLRHPHVDSSLWAGKIRNIPVILTPHSPYHKGARKPHLEYLARMYDAIQAMYQLRFFSRIIALHEEEKKWLVSKGVSPGRIRIVPNGVEDVFFDSPIKGAEKDRIIFVGRLHETKGADMLISAFSRIKNQKAWELILVGPDGGELPKLASMVKKAKLGKKVKFAGLVPEKILIRNLDESKIFVMPSRYEPFGISLIEAMARGKACIAFISDGPNQIIQNGQNGLLINADIDELGEAILNLQHDRKLRKKLGSNAKKTAQKYRWKTIAKKIFEEYKQLVRK